jgi:hypothetical protein
MKKPAALTLAITVITALVSIAAARQTPKEPPRMRPAATIQEIMDTMIDPSADNIWEAFSVTISAGGITQTSPRSDKDWADLRKSAVNLIEGANLLLVPGRRVASPGKKSENPGIELEPEEIEKRIERNAADWTAATIALQDVAAKTLAFIDKRDSEGIQDMGAVIDQACEACHLKFWYPDENLRAGPGRR